MAVGAFVEKAHQRTDKEIRESIGRKLALWEDLMQFMSDHCEPREDFAFYGKNNG